MQMTKEKKYAQEPNRTDQGFRSLLSAKSKPLLIRFWKFDVQSHSLGTTVQFDSASSIKKKEIY